MVEKPSTDGPFLSVIVRTIGRRPAELGETLLCLAAQTSDDFETIVVGHNLSEEGASAVEETIENAAPWLRPRIRFMTVDGGSRSRPLNVGFAAARGRYCAVLDDDDLVFAHWVETFASREVEAGDRIIRSRCVWQEAEVVSIHGDTTTSATSAPQLLHDEPFSFLRHVWANETPFMSVAYPRALHAAGLAQFNENLTTLEDWDYLLQAASLVGVIDVDEITSVYRRWLNAENSLASHTDQEWADNLALFEHALDARPAMLAAGETAVLRRLLSGVGLEGGESRRRVDTETLRDEALALIESRSWRLSAPMRRLATLIGRPQPVSRADALTADRTQLLAIIDAIRTSRSWYIARALRPSADRK